MSRPTEPQTTRADRRRGLARWAVGSVSVVAAVVSISLAATRVRWSPATIERAEQLLADGNHRRAAEEAAAVLRGRPGEARALFALALARSGSEDWTGSVAALEAIPDWSSRKPEALFLQGQALRKLHRGRDAEAALRACIARDADAGLNARLALLELLAMEERVEEFKRLVWEIHDRMPESDRLAVLTMRIRIEFEQSLPALNIASLRPMVAADPDDAHARAGLAAALDRDGKHAEARDLYAQALAKLPDDAELRERYLDLLHRRGDMAAWADVLANRPEGSETRPIMAKFLGMKAEADGDLVAAELAYARAAEADPSEPEYRHRRSLALFQLGRKAEANAQIAERTRLRDAREKLRLAWNAFATAFEADPASVTPDLVLDVARAFEVIGWSREAAGWFREALRRDPSHPEARAGLDRLDRQ